jgi:hypothetical protein
MMNQTPKIFSKFPEILAFFTDKANENLAFHVGDDPSLVEIRHEVLACQSGYDCMSLVHMRQIHSDIVHIVSDEDSFTTPPECDALITDKRNTPLMVMVADCAPILFYDPKRKVIAVAHAGRAGAFNAIASKTVQRMEKEFRTKPKDLLVCIGAGISPCCYEVGQEIADEAHAKGFAYALQTKGEKYFLDINKILRTQLLGCGIDAKHLEISNKCTACDTKTYFSYRAEGKTGRFSGVLMLR